MHWYSNLKNINYGVLRYFNAAGYDLDKRIVGLEKKSANLLPIIMETVMGKRKYLQVFGNDYNTLDGSAIRDYIHVTDLVRAHIKAMNYILDNKNQIILNLASGIGYSVMDIINKTRFITGKDIVFRVLSRRVGDPEKLVAKSSLTKKYINNNSRGVAYIADIV